MLIKIIKRKLFILCLSAVLLVASITYAVEPPAELINYLKA